MSRLIFALLVLAVATASASESRIVGGTPTTVDAFPWIVQVQRKFIGIWRQHCAGSILTSRYILSASSCFRGPDFISRLRGVIAGSSVRNVGGQKRYVRRVVQNPLWNEALGYEGDIALVQLESPLQFTPVVQQASILGQGAFIPDNMPATQLGWGLTLNEDFPSLYSTQLQQASVITINNAQCAWNYANLSLLPLTVTSKMVCAASLAESGACLGDRGGPLFINNIVVGVVSFGLGCANSTFPTVHTAVPSFTNWIVDNAV